MYEELRTIEREIKRDSSNNYWNIRTLFDNKGGKKSSARKNRFILKKMITHEEKIHKLKEALAKEQDKNTFLETYLTRSRRERREFLSSFILQIRNQ